MPLSDPAPRQPIHTRQITIEAFEREDGLIDLEATLVDAKPFVFRLSVDRPQLAAGEPIHRISLRLTVDADAVIRHTEVAMDATPYTYCSEVPLRFDLNGIRMGAGFMKAVREGGRIVVIHRADRLADLLALLGDKAGSFAIRPIHPYADQPAKRVLVQAIKTGKAPLRLLPPLVLHDRTDAKHSPEAEAILRGEAGLGF